MSTAYLWTFEQLDELEAQFQISQHCNLSTRKLLSDKLQVHTKYISRWFEERRSAYFGEDPPPVLRQPELPRYDIVEKKKKEKRPKKEVVPDPISSFEDLTLSPMGPMDLTLSPIDAISPIVDFSLFSPIAQEPIRKIEPPEPPESKKRLRKIFPVPQSVFENLPPFSPGVPIHMVSDEPIKMDLTELESQLRFRLEAEYQCKLHAALQYQETHLLEKNTQFYEKALSIANKRIEKLEWEMEKDPDAQLLSFLENLVNTFMIDERYAAKHHPKNWKPSIRLWHGRHKFAVMQYAQLSHRLNDESLPEQEVVRLGRRLTIDDIEMAFERAAVEVEIEENRKAELDCTSSVAKEIREALEARFGLDKKTDCIYRKRKSE